MFLVLLHPFSRSEMPAGPVKFIIASVVNLGAVTYVAYTHELSRPGRLDVGTNTVALLSAAFTASTSGHLATGLLGKDFDDHAEANRRPSPLGGIPVRATRRRDRSFMPSARGAR